MDFQQSYTYMCIYNPSMMKEVKHLADKDPDVFLTGLWRPKKVIFAFLLSKVVNGTNRTAPYRPFFSFPLCWAGHELGADTMADL